MMPAASMANPYASFGQPTPPGSMANPYASFAQAPMGPPGTAMTSFGVAPPPPQPGAAYPNPYANTAASLGGMPPPSPPVPPGGRHDFAGPFGKLHVPQQGQPVQWASQEAKNIIAQHGQESFPLQPEEAHMGFQPDCRRFDPASKDKHPLEATPKLQRTIVKLPHPRFAGGPEFVDGIAKQNATFAWTEICATNAPECSMAPVPQVAQKTWYNSYVYIPEQRSHVERHYLERFVPGPDGEWLDVVKARRMTSYLHEQRAKAEAIADEQRHIREGDGIEVTEYFDQYSGEKLLACNHQLMSKAEVYQRYNIHKSDWSKTTDDVPMFDYDNLRVPWLFGKVDRNKRVSQNAYDWFDRRNPRVVSDRSYKFMELPSYYVDEDLYNKWRPVGNAGLTGVAEDVAVRARYLDDYPYQM